MDHEAEYSTGHRDTMILPNHLLAQVISSLTAPLRCDGVEKLGVIETQTDYGLGAFPAHLFTRCSRAPSSQRRRPPGAVSVAVTTMSVSLASMMVRRVPRHGKVHGVLSHAPKSCETYNVPTRHVAIQADRTTQISLETFKVPASSMLPPIGSVALKFFSR